MKIKYSGFVSFKIKMLIYLITVIGCLFFFWLNVRFGIFYSIFFILFIWAQLFVAKKKEKWVRQTMENDPFIQSQGFKLASVGMYSMLMISNDILRVIVHNTKASNKKEVEEVFKNFPRQGTDMTLNGVNVYFLDINLKDIESVKSITNAEAGNIPLVGKSPFGIYLQLKDGAVYVIDTKTPSDFCDVIIQNKS